MKKVYPWFRKKPFDRSERILSKYTMEINILIHALASKKERFHGYHYNEKKKWSAEEPEER